MIGTTDSEKDLVRPFLLPCQGVLSHIDEELALSMITLKVES